MAPTGADVLRGPLLGLITFSGAVACGTAHSAPAGSDGGAAPHVEGGNAPCSEDPSTIAAGAVCVHDISGRFIDGAGDPVPDLVVSACGPEQCNPGDTGDDGAFTIAVNRHIVVADYSVVPHGRPEKAAFYFRVPGGGPGPDIDMGDLRQLSMPESGPPLVIDPAGAPAQSVTSGEVTLDVDDGVSVRLDVDSNLAGDAGKQFRALRVPDELLGDFADPELGLVALYGFEPFESQFEIPGDPPRPADVQLTFDNTETLAPGSAVEVLALGSYLHPEWVEPAAFEPVATGHVTDDGSRIVMDAGQGVRYLTWVGLRPAP